MPPKRPALNKRPPSKMTPLSSHQMLFTPAQQQQQQQGNALGNSSSTLGLDLGLTGKAVRPSPPRLTPPAATTTGGQQQQQQQRQQQQTPPQPPKPPRNNNVSSDAHLAPAMLCDSASFSSPIGCSSMSSFSPLAKRPPTDAAAASSSLTYGGAGDSFASTSAVFNDSKGDASAAATTGTGSVSGTSKSRVGRLLRDARAAVQQPLRPETPAEHQLRAAATTATATTNTDKKRYEFLRGNLGKQPKKTTTTTTSSSGGLQQDSSPEVRKGSRLASLRDATGRGSSSTALDSGAIDADSYLRVLTEAAAAGDGARQITVLRSMMRWLANPAHTMREEWVHCFAKYIEACNNNSNSNDATATTKDDDNGELAVSVVMASVLMHNVDLSECVALPDVLCLLMRTASQGKVSWMARELVFEPLLHILRTDDVLTDQPQIIVEVLEVLVRCTMDRKAAITTTTSREHGSGGGDQASSSADDVTMQLITLGVIPTLNNLTEKVLDSDVAENSRVDGSDESILTAAGLLYRNLSTDHSHHLRKLGTLNGFIRILTTYKTSTSVVTAVSRALAKVVFDYDCLMVLQRDIRLTQAAIEAMQAQVSAFKKKQNQCSGGSDSDQTSDVDNNNNNNAGSASKSELSFLVSRLCSVIARVAEGCPIQHDYLAQCGQQLMIDLMTEFGESISSSGSPTTASSSPEDGALVTHHASADGPDSHLSVMQGVVWVVGVAALSSQCSLLFVQRVLPLIVRCLKDMDFNASTRLTAIYVLMCLSNLSYYFPLLESPMDEGNNSSSDDDTAEDAARDGSNLDLSWRGLGKLYSTLGLVLAGFLFEGDAECIVEATRVLGNMAYTNTGRDWMEENRCDEILVLFLGHEDLRIVYNCFGAVLNLTAATSCRVVEDPQLLSMMLTYTSRFTRKEAIADAAIEEAKLLLTARSSANSKKKTKSSSSSNGGGATAVTYRDPVRPQSAQQARGGSPSSPTMLSLTNNSISLSATVMLEEEEVSVEEMALAEAQGYAHQTADLVEKVLANVRGLLAGKGQIPSSS